MTPHRQIGSDQRAIRHTRRYIDIVEVVWCLFGTPGNSAHARNDDAHHLRLYEDRAPEPDPEPEPEGPELESPDLSARSSMSRVPFSMQPPHREGIATHRHRI